MRRSRYVPKALSHEFELDLAPLLAVMVKLVPVLIVGSAFVQVSILETDVPQIVKEAIVEPNKQDEKRTSITLVLSNEAGATLAILNEGKVEQKVIPAIENGKQDLAGIHQELVAAKKRFPSVFKLELKPNSNVSYDTVVKVMDEARRARDPKIEFTFQDKSKNTEVKTPYMFPDVVFANVLEG